MYARTGSIMPELFLRILWLQQPIGFPFAQGHFVMSPFLSPAAAWQPIDACFASYCLGTLLTSKSFCVLHGNVGLLYFGRKLGQESGPVGSRTRELGGARSCTLRARLVTTSKLEAAL